jgi:hypothetical protein
LDEALFNKPENRGFESRLIFSIDLILPVATWPRGLLNLYQKSVPENISGDKAWPELKV